MTRCLRTLSSALLCCLAGTATVIAQTAVADHPVWQQAAGNIMTFEVASVRQDDGPFQPPSFALSDDDWFREPTGRFHADFELSTYIQFAYKLHLTGEERKAALAKLPEWVRTDRFLIQATAPLHATKDQYRLMMQALLADRFGLKLHFEIREMPVLTMVLAKPGIPGPRLIPHDKGQPCDSKTAAGTFPSECYSYSARPWKDGLWLTGSRATSLPLIANFVGDMAGNSEEISRRVVDGTGLTGLWDFTVEAAAPNQAAAQAPDATGPTMLQALQEQLGIRLKPGKAVVPVLIVDHVEPLRAN